MPYKNSEAKRAANRRHYLKNRERYREQVKARKRERRKAAYAYTNEIKSTTPCADCDEYYDPICMDFDHCQDDKLEGVSRMINTDKPLMIIMAEVAKCEVVCANCHRIRTRERG